MSRSNTRPEDKQRKNNELTIQGLRNIFKRLLFGKNNK